MYTKEKQTALQDLTQVFTTFIYNQQISPFKIYSFGYW
jgi:hypothetical protein